MMINPSGPLVLTELPRSKNVKRSGHAGAFTWPERFFVREAIPPLWENTPFFAATLRVRDSDEALEDPEDEDLIHSLKTEENWAPDTYRVESFLDIFQGATLRKLQKGEETVPTDAVALLIDGNNVKGQPRFRNFLGGLSAGGLLNELTKKRYLEDQDVTDEKFIEAERRLIYIDTADSWSILALIGTAPESLHRPLTEFILDYIRSRCRIGVSFATEGPETFTLQFSFPFRAFRSTSTPQRDPRMKKSDQEPLRLSTDITFLSNLAGAKLGKGIHDMIYSTHFSLMVTGYDQFRWTGVGVAEAWFEDKRDDPSPDAVARYWNDYQDGNGLVSDPLCRGKGDTTRTIWSPRSYFIHTLGVRLEQIYKEWEGVHSHFYKRIKAASKRHEHLLANMQDLSCTPHLGARNVDKQRHFENGIREVDKFLKGCVHNLEETLRSGNRFMETDVNYFLHHDGEPGDASDCIPRLSQIRQTFHDIAQQLTGFSDLRDECKEILKSGVTAKKEYLLQIKTNRAVPASQPAVPQPAVPRQPLDIQILSCTTIISQPLLNTAAIFSCDGIVPFPRTWYYFLCSVVVMAGLMSLIVVIRIHMFGHCSSSVKRQPAGFTTARTTDTGPVESQDEAFAESDTPQTLRRCTFG